MAPIKGRLSKMTAQDVLDCCDAAQKSIKPTVNGQVSFLFPFSYTQPRKVGNKELIQMRKVYLEMLDTPSQWSGIMKMLTDMQPAGAAAALFFLEYPGLVWSERASSVESDENPYPMTDIIQKILFNEDLLRWCRETIKKPDTHRRLIESAINLMNGALLFGTDRKDSICHTLVGDKSEKSMHGFFACLSEILKRDDVIARTVVDCYSLFFFVSPYCDVKKDWSTEPEATSFRLALERVSINLEDRIFKACATFFGPQDDDEPQAAQA